MARKRPLFSTKEQAAPRLLGFFPGTDKPYSARREAYNILYAASKEGVDVQALAEHLGPLARDGHWPDEPYSTAVKIIGGGRLDAEALLSLALMVVLQRSQQLYSDLRHAIDIGDDVLLVSTVAGMVSVEKLHMGQKSPDFEV